MKRFLVFLMLFTYLFTKFLFAQGNKITYDLGADKKEADDSISSMLESVRDSWQQITLPDNSHLKIVEDRDYVALQGDTFMIESVHSNTYYKKGDPTVAIFDSLHVKESIFNLLLQKVDMSNMSIEILHRKYGLLLPTYQVRWADLLSVLLDKGHKCYAAVRMDKNNNQATGILIVNHPSQEFIHLLMLSFNPKDLFTHYTNRGKGISVSGLLYTNTPYRNVLDLFEERYK